VGWLNELFSALELGDNIHLMGLSYGGWLTSQYALHSPDRLGKAVLLAPAATVLPTQLESSLRALLMLVPLRRFYRSFFFWIFNDLVQRDAQLVEEIVNEMIITMRCFKPANSIQMPLTVLKDEELQSIKVPTLFLVGENEVLYSAQKAVQRLNEVAPQIGTEVIPKAGHDLTVVQAEMVNQKVLEFLVQL
jgi:pimeloyl-ACP methyl ester carboxylesterase